MLFKKKRHNPPERRPHITQPPARNSAVFSYHANRSVREGRLSREASAELFEPSAPAKRLPKIALLKRSMSVVGLVAVAVIAIVCLQLSNKPKVVMLGNDKSQAFLRGQDVYEAAAQKAFASLLNRNKLTVNAGKIAADLEQQFPELRAVSVSLPFIGAQPVVYIQPTTPQLILVAQGGVFVLDSNGRALIAGNQVAHLSQLDAPVVTDESKLPIQVGKIALPRDTTLFISNIVAQLKAKGYDLSSLVLPPGTNELHVRFRGVGYFVKYNLHGNAREEAGAFMAVKERLDAEHKVPREYIDVRVENRAYYK